MALLKIAARIGGPAIEQYLLRQDWWADPEDLPRGQQMGIGAVNNVNGWLYLLANLPSPTGREFRLENQHQLMEMADRLTANLFSPFWERGMEFLFLDLDLGSNSLAMRYWPRFKEAAAREKHDTLSFEYQYLVRIEPLPTADMYLQCWKEFRGHETEFYEALDVFAKSSVPYHKRLEIHAALAGYIQRDVGNVDIAGRPNEQDLRRNLLVRLEQQLLPITEDERAEDLFAELRAGNSRYTPENVAAWLAHGEPTHPLVGMLADAE